jgi:prevent-host-death family protein
MKTMEIGAFEAKTHLSELLEKVRHGRTFFITKRGHPVAELRPVSIPGRRPRFASDRNRVKIRADFDAPIADLKDYTE